MPRTSMPCLSACFACLLASASWAQAPVAVVGVTDQAMASAVSQQAYVKASNTGAVDVFGSFMALSGDTLVVSAYGEDSNATGVGGNQASNSATESGAVYVFVRNGSSWTQQAYLKASNTGAGDKFGRALALSGDTLVVGAPHEGSNATGVNGDQGNELAVDAGAAYVFVRDGTTWSQQAYLKPSNTGGTIFGGGDRFGWSVAVSGDTVVVGALDEDSAATGVNGNEADNSSGNAGAAYVFVRDGTSWSQQAYLKASNTGFGDQFGGSVAASGDTIVVGATWEGSGATGVNGDGSDNSKTAAGAAYVFVRSGASWSQQAYLKASNTDANDRFGWSLAVDGDTAVVGAPVEASAATGVDGDQDDDSAGSAGAAYVFVRSGASWSQQAYLKASDSDLGDQFAASLALSGDALVVGATFEDSAATGVNGDDSDDSVQDSGAAYVFVRDGATWSQQAYLKSSNSEANDLQGLAVALSGDTVAVGANSEDSNATGVNGDQGDNSSPGSGAAYVFDVADITPDPWSDQGCALAGVVGDPLLAGTGTLAAESGNSALLTNAAPSAMAGLFLALGSVPVPFKGGTLKPFPFLPPVFVPTSPSGTISLPFVMPLGVPSETQLWVQWGIQDATAIAGIALSNAIVGVTP